MPQVLRIECSFDVDVLLVELLVLHHVSAVPQAVLVDRVLVVIFVQVDRIALKVQGEKAQVRTRDVGADDLGEISRQRRTRLGRGLGTDRLDADV